VLASMTLTEKLELFTTHILSLAKSIGPGLSAGIRTRSVTRLLAGSMSATELGTTSTEAAPPEKTNAAATAAAIRARAAATATISPRRALRPPAPTAAAAAVANSP